MARQSDVPRKITAAEMTDALSRSGYLLESRVARMLRSKWEIQPNWTYPDPETGKLGFP
jgi:hypothetical protein